MASKPFFDKRRGNWMMKYKPDPAGDWVKVKLCKHPGPWSEARPPKKPPQLALDRAAAYAEQEYRASTGVTTPKRESGLLSYVADYQEAYRGSRAVASVRRSSQAVTTFLGWCRGRGIDSVQQVTRPVCRDYLEWRAGQVAVSTLHTEKGYLSPVFSRAEEDGLIPANPWRRNRVPGKRQPPVPTFWTEGEVKKLVAGCTSPLYADLVLVTVNTGLRATAGLNLAFDWIHWDEGFIRVPKEFSKNGRPYDAPLSRTARDVLQRRLGASKDGRGVVFPREEGGRAPVSYKAFWEMFSRLVVRAGVKPGTPHDLRHTFGRSLVLSGAPITVVQAALGHRSLAMTEIYTRLQSDDARPHLEDFGIGDG